jgi:hypothetical protein
MADIDIIIPVGINIETIINDPNPKYPVLCCSKPNIKAKAGDTMIVYHTHPYTKYTIRLKHDPIFERRNTNTNIFSNETQTLLRHFEPNNPFMGRTWVCILDFELIS